MLEASKSVGEIASELKSIPDCVHVKGSMLGLKVVVVENRGHSQQQVIDFSG
jgi:hypothetical protein